MEDAKSTIEEEHDQFLDASNEFPFYDCPDSFNLSSPSQPTLSLSSFPDSNSFSAGLRRRRSFRTSKLKEFEIDSTNLKSDRVESTSQSVNEQENDSSNSINLNSDGAESTSNTVIEGVNEEEKENSMITRDEKDQRNDQMPVSERERDMNDGQFSLLVFLAEMVIKAIAFQFNLLISFVSFPFWVLYYCCMIAVNPLFIVGVGKRFMLGKLKGIWKLIGDTLSPFLTDWLNEHKSLFNLVLRCGWGLFWSVYVCSVLVTLLVSAFVVGGLIMRFYFVQEPFQLKQGLNFDYTKSKPVAFVPIVFCPTAECQDINEVANAAGLVRVIPPKHKLQATVTMVLPESDYNRNLGIFQVRVEFLSENGKSLASFSHPCMLEFKSQPLRLLLTFFKIVPLVAGYLSETQILKLKFRGYNEGVIPTACLKITMEQRAEFRPGAGIPEIYDAFVHLESELPFLKRILWYWRRTIFVWLGMTVFGAELLFLLICCRPLIIPRARTRSNITRNNTPLTTHPVQS